MKTALLNETSGKFQYLSLRSRFIGGSKLNSTIGLNFRLLRHFIPRNDKSSLFCQSSAVLPFKNNQPENLQSFFAMMMSMMYMSDLMRDGIT